jgi:indolepyruvate ferredoxin oxidoreductase alpha subunit
MEQRIMLGNEAIGRGLVEAGCSLVASYPGTPASEILESTVDFAKECKAPMHIEWSINEKVAYEVALGNSYTGKRSAVAMKQVGLNVASDPFMRSAYLGVIGGLVVIVADDPGPHSSQTEQDSRFFAQFARIPVFDPSDPAEAKEMIERAFELSETYEIPVMVRPTTRVCHARRNVSCLPPKAMFRRAAFKKNPGRWVATPQFLTTLHREVNAKIDDISGLGAFYPFATQGDGTFNKCCIISSGVAYANTYEILDDLGLLGKIDFFKVDLPYPLNKDFIQKINADYEKILVIEETYPVIEMQLACHIIKGRISKDIPDYGELSPEIIENILRKFLNVTVKEENDTKEIKEVRPSLCPGCPHRAAFYAIRKTFPKGIFPSDIGCYTLGMNFGAVDTCHCMGACISQGAGFYHAYAADGPDYPTVVVTIGDSTFFHAGIPALVNAVFTGARFILVILDNSTTAMTGNQPTPQVGIMADGSPGNKVYIPDLVGASGVRFLKECDPYNLESFKDILTEADRFCRGDDGGVAVIIAKHPCIMDKQARAKQSTYRMQVTEKCTGCKVCIERFECSSLVFDEATQKVFIDKNSCIGCGVCESVCPAEAITAEELEVGK